MNIAYLREETTPSGALRSVLAHADALVARGHRVRIVTKDQPLAWRRSSAEWIYLDDFREYDAGDDDVVFDASYIPKLVVEDEFFRAHDRTENDPPRVLLCGSTQNERRGIPDGYGAVAHARWFHQKLDLIRVSHWAPSREEPLDAVQEFHVALTTDEMTRLMHSCDILLAPTHPNATLGTSAAEALASGLACVLTAIPTYTSFASERDFALFAPAHNPVELGERLIELLGDEDLRAGLRERARAVSHQWRVDRMTDQLEQELARARRR